MPIPSMAVTSPNGEISATGARRWQKYSATRAEALRKMLMLTPAPDKSESRSLIPDMIDERNPDQPDDKYRKDSGFEPTGGKYPIVAQKMEDRPKRAAGAKKTSSGLQIRLKA
jgi:hypothetical protein